MLKQVQDARWVPLGDSFLCIFFYSRSKYLGVYFLRTWIQICTAVTNLQIASRRMAHSREWISNRGIDHLLCGLCFAKAFGKTWETSPRAVFFFQRADSTPTFHPPESSQWLLMFVQTWETCPIADFLIHQWCRCFFFFFERDIKAV